MEEQEDVIKTQTKYPLVLYFVLAYLLSWIFWIPRVLIVNYPNYFNGIIIISFLSNLFFLGVFGPLLAALIVIGLERGKSGLQELGRRCVKWRINIRWYVVVFILPICIFIVVDMIYLLAGGDLGSILSLNPLFILIAFIYILFLGGGLEEPGWRGYAQPNLMKNYDTFKTSIILGLFWSFWHLPLFFIPGSSQYGIFFPGYLIYTIGITIIVAWVYNNTQSVFLCILLHTMFNLAAGLFAPSLTHLMYGIILICVIYIFILFLLLRYGKETLMRAK